MIHAENRGSGWRNIEVAKNRYGHIGELRLYLRGECLKFEEASLIEDAPIEDAPF